MPAILKTTQIQEPSSATVNIGLDSSGNVGVGTTSPSAKLNVYDATSSTFFVQGDSTVSAVIQRSISANTAPQLGLRKSRGTVASPTAVASGDNVAQILVQAYGGSNYRNIAAIFGSVDTYTSDTDISGYLTFATSPSGSAVQVERMRIDSSGYMQGTVNGLSAGRIPAMQFFRLNSDLAGANATGAQNVFGVGVTLVGSTVYAFDYYAVFSKSAGATSHTFSIGFGGTATINNILYGGAYNNTNAAYAAGAIQSSASFDSNTATSTVLTAATTATGKTNYIYLKGTVSINAGGTFIPQYTLSAAPGGAYSTVAGSYFAIYPLAASGSNVSIGSWA